VNGQQRRISFRVVRAPVVQRGGDLERGRRRAHAGHGQAGGHGCIIGGSDFRPFCGLGLLNGRRGRRVAPTCRQRPIICNCAGLSVEIPVFALVVFHLLPLVPSPTRHLSIHDSGGSVRGVVGQQAVVLKLPGIVAVGGILIGVSHWLLLENIVSPRRGKL